MDNKHITLKAAERKQLETLLAKGKLAAKVFKRATALLELDRGKTMSAVAQTLAVSYPTVLAWRDKYLKQGLKCLHDAPRSGRPRTYRPDETNQVIAKARSLPPKPAEGEVPPTCHWTLDRLQAELAKDGIAIKRSQIRRILRAEHLKWQKPRTWLESTDPHFAEKRGPSSASTPTRRRAAR